jgi:hypothetical protein
MGNHAVLSPSGADRWLKCTPSARLEQDFPDSSGAAAKEGTLAHTLGELLIRKNSGRISAKDSWKEIAAIEKDPLYDAAMYEHCENYAVFVLEQFSEAQARTKDAMLFLEQKLDLTAYIPEGFGTGDAVIIADHTLMITDLKYGKGVPVSSENNRQMMLYGLGALHAFDYLYDIHRVRMTIYQPRIDNTSTWEIPVEELRHWAESELIPRAALAFEGKGDFAPGLHCRFCRAKGLCKANADFNLELAKHDFKEPTLLTEDEVSDILDRADMFKKWLAGVEGHALHEAINNGKKWPGYKVVEGRSNRKYTDEVEVANVLLKQGFAEDLIYTKSIVGITAMEKAIGKATFNAILSDLLIKPPGKPALVPETDKRPEYNSIENAIADFADIEIDN